MTIRKNAQTYAELALLTEEAFNTGLHDVLHKNLHDLFMDIAGSAGIAWQDTRRCGRGIARRLQDLFPVEVGPFKFDITQQTPFQAFRLYSSAGERASWEEKSSLADVYGLLANFCHVVHTTLLNLDKNSPDGGMHPQDFTVKGRRNYSVKRFCQFCWRLVDFKPGATKKTCLHHDPVENQANYRAAKRQGLKTPGELKLIFSRAEHFAVLGQDPLWDALHFMATDWDAAADAGIPREFAAGLEGMTYHPLPKGEWKNWAEFHNCLCKAFDAGWMPDDPRFTFAWLRYALQEVQQATEKKRLSKEGERARVVALREQLGDRRGVQTEIAKQLGISRQRVSQILKD